LELFRQCDSCVEAWLRLNHERLFSLSGQARVHDSIFLSKYLYQANKEVSSHVYMCKGLSISLFLRLFYSIVRLFQQCVVFCFLINASTMNYYQRMANMDIQDHGLCSFVLCSVSWDERLLLVLLSFFK